MELNIKRIFEILENGHPIFWTLAGIGSVGLLGIIDTLTGNEITFSLFYMAPLVVVTWTVNQSMGLLMSLLSALTLLAAEIASGQIYSSPTIYVANTLIRAGFYVIVTYLVAELHKARRRRSSWRRVQILSRGQQMRVTSTNCCRWKLIVSIDTRILSLWCTSILTTSSWSTIYLGIRLGMKCCAVLPQS
jgi:hypothetical protein